MKGAAPAPGGDRRPQPIAEPLQRFTRLLWSTLGLLAAGPSGRGGLAAALCPQPLTVLRRRLAAVRGRPFSTGTAASGGRVQPRAGRKRRHGGAERVPGPATWRTLCTPLAVLANAAAGRTVPWLGWCANRWAARAAKSTTTWRARAMQLHRARHQRPGTGTAGNPAAHHGSGCIQHAGSTSAARQAEDTLAFRGEEQDLYELLGNLSTMPVSGRVRVSMRRCAA